MRCLVLFLVACSGRGGEDSGFDVEPTTDWFADITAAHGLGGIAHVARNALDGTVVAVHDLDADGYVDLVFAPGLQPIVVAWGSADGVFTRDLRGLPSHAARALTAADLDGDGTVELITADAGLRAFRFDGGFVEVTDELGLGEAAIAEIVDLLPADLDRDGRLDLHVGQWGPANLTLVQGVGGSFAEVDLLAAPEEESWTATWADLDDDGIAELFVATDTREVDYGEGEPYAPGQPHDRLYVDVDGVWQERAEARGLDGQRSTMGGLPTDLDGDGRTDLWLPNLGRSHALVASGEGYVHAADSLGLGGAVRRDELECVSGGDLRSCLLTSWASIREDIDGDGILDLFVVNGGLEEDWRGPQPAQLFMGGASRHQEVAVTALPARSLAPVDLDGDGDLDFVIGTHNANVVAWETAIDVPSRWRVSLRPSLSPAEGRGARVVATWGETSRTLFVGAGGVAMTSLPPWLEVHGPPPDQVVVHWPSGIEQTVSGEVDLLVAEPEVLELSATEVPGDGVSTVVVEVRPHDGTVALGAGEDVVIEATMGTWTGPVVDLGDGRYQRTLVAPSGVGEARITAGWGGDILHLRPKLLFRP